MAKPLTDLQQAAQDVIRSFEVNARLFPGTTHPDIVVRAIRHLQSVLHSAKPVGRPRTIAHDPAKASCTCIDCRKRRKESREQLSHSEYSHE